MNSMIMITNRWDSFGSFKYLGMIVQYFWISREIYDFDVGTSSKHNCAMTPRYSFFGSSVMTLELIIFLRFPMIPSNSNSFPSEKNSIMVLEN